jgi:hypothetical protein
MIALPPLPTHVLCTRCHIPVPLESIGEPNRCLDNECPLRLAEARVQ